MRTEGEGGDIERAREVSRHMSPVVILSFCAGGRAKALATRS
jgi:hypothetical protein